MGIDTFNKELLFKYFNEETSPVENKRILRWIESNPDHKTEFIEYKTLWDALKQPFPHTPSEGDWNELSIRIKVSDPPGKQKNKRWIHILQYAAVFILGLLSVWIYDQYIPHNQSNAEIAQFNEIIVPKGSRTRLVLPDGTEVWLNAESKFRYAKDFNKSNRDVFLEGEGYFEVSPDKNSTFLVKTPDINVIALGTKFNVKAYPKDKIIETTLVEGKIKVEKGGQSKITYDPLYLLPNQTLAFHKDTESLTLKDDKRSANDEIEDISQELQPSKIEEIVLHEDIDPIVYTSWKDSKWIIESESLEKLAVEFERRFDVTIEFTDQELKNMRFTGTLKDESLEQVLKAMKLTADMDYKIDGKQVLFMKKNEHENF